MPSRKLHLKRLCLMIPPLVFAHLLLGITSPQLLAQEGDTRQESEGRRIYRLTYEAAMADSVITPDEDRMLTALQQALGLDEEIIEEALGERLPARAPGLNQSGRWTLMLQNMGWGIGLYGWGLPFVLDVDDFKWYVGGEMFSLGASLYLTWKYTQGINLPEARSQMQRYGGVVGFHYGVALNRLLKTEDRLPVMVLMAAVPVGTWAGDRLYRHWRPSTGQAYALALHAELGRSVLSLVHRQIDARPQEPQFGDDTASERDLSWQKINTVLQVAGYPLGTYLGHRLYGNRQYSFGDAALLIVGRGAGALYGFLLTDLLDFDFDEDNMGWRWLVMAGGLGGVAGMDRYMRSYDFTFGQAAMLTLGGVAGAAFAAGFGVILEIDEVKYYELAAIGGSLGGLALTRRIVNPRLESSRAQGPETGPQLNLALQPMLVGGNFRPGLGLELRW